MSTTSIEWTQRSWNPIVGCSIVSPGCTNCYAMKQAARIQKMNPTGGSGSNYVNHYDGTTKVVNGNVVWTGKIAIAPDRIFLEPLRRKEPTTWFVNSMGDLFHEDVPNVAIDHVFAVMALCPQHTFQVLTKRAKRMQAYIAEVMHDQDLGLSRFGIAALWRGLHGPEGHCPAWPLPNVWLGVSAEDQTRADERIPLLLQTPAAVRFVSCEPLLGPIDLTEIEHAPAHCLHALAGIKAETDGTASYGARLDWVIVGGESGPGARPMHPGWARTLRDQCAAADVPFFMKQMTKKAPIPDDLMVRQFPAEARP